MFPLQLAETTAAPAHALPSKVTLRIWRDGTALEIIVRPAELEA